MKHSDLERLLDKEGQELMRQLYQDCVDEQAQAQVTDEVVDAQGRQRTRKRQQHRELETIFGTVEVDRNGYGAQGAASLHPLDAQMNLPEERYSLEVRRRTALEASKNSFDETAETLSRYTGAKIGKRQVEELVRRAAEDFDAFYEQRHQAAAEQADAEQADAEQADEDQTAAEPPAADALLVISSDGKGVVMHQQDLRPATRTASERTPRSKMGSRLSKGEKRNRKRMSTVAAVYSVAPHVRTPEQMLAALARDEEAEPSRRRPRPQHKRVWASLEHEPRQVLEEALREALQRDPHRTRRWVAVVDGNETQLDILEDLAERHDVQLTIVLDIFHVLEYLWKAGHALCAEGSTTLEQWVLHRLGRVLEGRRCPRGCRHAPQRHQAPPDDSAARAGRPVRQLPAEVPGLPGLRSVPRRRAANRLRRHRRRLPPLGQRPAWHHWCALAAARSRGGAAPQSASQQWRFRRILGVPRGAGVAAYPSAALRRRTGADAAAVAQRTTEPLANRRLAATYAPVPGPPPTKPGTAGPRTSPQTSRPAASSPLNLLAPHLSEHMYAHAQAASRLTYPTLWRRRKRAAPL